MRLIDADAMKKDLCECCSLVPEKCGGGCSYHIAVDRQPTIDPVKHGHWIYDGGFAYICSVCRDSMEWTPPYCCECGACMDEVVDNERTERE